MPDNENMRTASGEARNGSENNDDFGSRRERSKRNVVDALRDTNYTSVLFGWLASVGVALILALILLGFFATGLDESVSQGSQESWQRAGVVGTVFLAFLAGGYVAGRMAGRSGIQHGVLVPLLALVLTLVLVLFGLIVSASLTDSLSGATLPQVPRELQQSLDTVFSASGILALIFAPIVGGIFGGAWGARTGKRKAQHEDEEQRG